MGRLSEAVEGSGSDRPKKLVIPRVLHEQLREVAAESAGPCRFLKNRPAAGLFVGSRPAWSWSQQHETSRTRLVLRHILRHKKYWPAHAAESSQKVKPRKITSTSTNAHSPEEKFAFAGFGIKPVKTRWVTVGPIA
jgi:hypothetical protein